MVLDGILSLNQCYRVGDIEGVVEQVGLKSSIFRRQDRSLAFIPNGLFLETPAVAVRTLLRQAIDFEIHLDHCTPAAQVRALVREIDSILQIRFRQLTLVNTNRQEEGLRDNTYVCLRDPFVVYVQQAVTLHTEGAIVKARSQVGVSSVSDGGDC